MKLKELIQELTELQKQGYGEEDVYFNQSILRYKPVECVDFCEETMIAPRGVYIDYDQFNYEK